jgi:hypothetical protein
MLPVEGEFEVFLNALGMNPDTQRQFFIWVGERMAEVSKGDPLSLTLPEMILTMRVQPMEVQFKNGESGYSIKMEYRGWPIGWEKATKENTRPHGRACGWKAHEHGTDCHANCPTCHGREHGWN